LSFSEEKQYDDQIVIVDGIGITHFIPRRKPEPAKKEKKGR
jgi:predicted ferric reductase